MGSEDYEAGSYKVITSSKNKQFQEKISTAAATGSYYSTTLSNIKTSCQQYQSKRKERQTFSSKVCPAKLPQMFIQNPHQIMHDLRLNPIAVESGENSRKCQAHEKRLDAESECAIECLIFSTIFFRISYFVFCQRAGNQDCYNRGKRSRFSLLHDHTLK